MESSQAPAGPGYLWAETDGQPRTLIGFGRPEFQICIVPRALAAEIIKTRHYSRRIVQNSFLHLGVFIDGGLVGILQFGWPMNPKGSLSIIRVTDYRRLIELNRMWLDDAAPRNSESRALAYAMRLIAKLRPEVVAIQSFADSRCGLNGVVYQAAGFRYYGSHLTSFYELDGETFHSMLLSTLRTHPSDRGRRLKAGIDRAVLHKFRQHRYLYFMRGRWRRLALLKERPFPKPEARP